MFYWTFGDLVDIQDRQSKGWITDCFVIQRISKKNHTNWLMSIGAKECSLNIQHNSVYNIILIS